MLEEGTGVLSLRRSRSEHSLSIPNAGENLSSEKKSVGNHFCTKSVTSPLLFWVTDWSGGDCREADKVISSEEAKPEEEAAADEPVAQATAPPQEEEEKVCCNLLLGSTLFLEAPLDSTLASCCCCSCTSYCVPDMPKDDGQLLAC